MTEQEMTDMVHGQQPAQAAMWAASFRGGEGTWDAAHWGDKVGALFF